ncbi:tripartite motif-containing protein 3-like isoform X2 [Branchiostoma lanceolatum]|uniref:tripartite motif-containing protein 3-like isoform X2 n=1 Tax=Branchiostoma lanceolatum TaxID=7740 RepID=UPI0034572DDA
MIGTSSPAAPTTDHDDLVTTSTEFPHTTKGVGSSKTEKQVSATMQESYSGYVYLDSDKIVFGQRGSDKGQFKKPSGVVVSDDSEIFVTDSENFRVQVFRTDGFYLRSFQTVVPGENNRRMLPRDVAIDGEACLWVVGRIICDKNTHVIVVVQYSRDGQPGTKFEVDIFYRAYRRGTPIYTIAVDVHKNKIILAGSDEVFMYRPDGSFNQKFRKVQKYYPSFVASDKEHIFVGDKGFVQVYNHTGHWLFRFGGYGRYEGELCHPQSILVDTSGHILVANLGTGRVDMFTRWGEFVRTVVSTPSPSGIAIGPRGHLVVTNRYDNTVTIFPPQDTFL